MAKETNIAEGEEPTAKIFTSRSGQVIMRAQREQHGLDSTLTNNHRYDLVEEMDFSWAESYPEVHKVCTLFSLTNLSSPLRYSYTPLESFIQDGPQCGLVALAMYLGTPNTQLVDSLLTIAKNNNYSFNGEMFSAENMKKLAMSEAKNSIVELHTGPLDCPSIKEKLLNGTCILVPYDTAKDNSPSLLNGNKAHWAIISGAVESASGFYVLARHGKAKNVGIWSLADLSASNMQLNQVGLYQKQPEIGFRMPEGGIAGPLGLKSKSVLLTKTKK